MQKFFYNNHYTPPFPEVEGCPYIMLLKITEGTTLQWPYDVNRPRYVALFSELELFFGFSTNKQYGLFIELNEIGYNWKAYYTIEGGVNWAQFATDWPETQTALSITNVELVWHNTGLYDFDTGQTLSKKTGEQLVEGADAPSVGYVSSDLTILEGRKPQAIYSLFQSPNENGTLRYTWHIVSNNSDGGAVGNNFYLYIPTIYTGTFQFYCLVDNVIEKDYTTTIGRIITVTIEAADAIPIEEKTEWLIGYLIGNAIREKR